MKTSDVDHEEESPVRQSFQRPAAALASAVLFAATLAGCASGTRPPAETPSADHTTHAGHDASAVDKSKLSKELYVFNWTEYLPESVLKEFQNQYGVKVNYDTYSSNEEMHAKLKAGGGGYDLVFPSDWMAGLLKRVRPGGVDRPRQHPQHQEPGPQIQRPAARSEERVLGALHVGHDRHHHQHG